MKKLFSLLLILCMLYNPSMACLNYFYGTDKDGHTHEMTYVLKDFFYKNFNTQKHLNSLRELNKKLEKEHSYKYLSDYSVTLMKLGKTDIAVDILQVLHYHYPNDYKIVANLGTAYELNSELDSALKYIKKGIKLNPNSHGGSEWIHVKILEAKQKITQNPSYLSQNSILALSETQKNDKEVYTQINIQLRERFPFSSPPNDVMAHLLIELAECSENVESVEYANALYKMVKNYYKYDSDYLDEKIKETQKLKQKYAKEKIENPADTSRETNHDRLTYLSYKQFLQEFPQIKINWNKINTDTDSLLSLAKLKKMPKSIQDKTTTTENNEPKDVEIDTDKNKYEPAIKEKFIHGGINYPFLGLFIVVIVLLIIYFIIRKN
ncbi:tetratricopeptide repeat protein [Bernardetia sp.]|uniref:tetratricopeptide repeat protein n=1 Tax=Bernardetia sp. TaxID=1937974 RepID=UPI0025BC8EBF|nr:tetratricopeptide repeat protein [Bernardetia sp.]